jgi:hypothetical protein
MAGLKVKYRNWIFLRFLHEPEIARDMATEAVKEMKKSFRYLRIVSGVVSSKYNIDNYRDHEKQYPHSWLVDKDGTIIDPSVAQFHLINPGGDCLKYKELVPKYEEQTLGRCINCGAYSFDYFCECGDMVRKKEKHE